MIKMPFEAALDIINPIVLAIREDQLHNSTPCAEWDVTALLNHMCSELAWVPEMLSGKTVEQVGDAFDGDLLNGDPLHAWRRYAETARISAQITPPQSVIHLSSGNLPANAYLDEIAGELIVHAWDVSRSIGVPFHIPEDIAQAMYVLSWSKAEGWRKQGILGPEVPVPEGASNESKLLGLFGRKG